MGKGSGKVARCPMLIEPAGFAAEEDKLKSRYPDFLEYLVDDSQQDVDVFSSSEIECCCPRCGYCYVVYVSQLKALSKKGWCLKCDYKQSYLPYKYDGFSSWFSSYNPESFSSSWASASHLWHCAKGHTWYSTAADLKHRGCPGCSDKWNRYKFKSILLGKLLLKEDKLTTDEMLDVFTEESLLGNERRATSSRGDLEVILSNDYSYEELVEYCLGDYTQVQTDGDNVNLRKFGGNIRFTRSQREKIWTRDGKKCNNTWCSFGYREYLPYSNLHIDHIQPLAKGGKARDENNLQALCASCNSDKSDKDPFVWLEEQKKEF